MEGKKRRNRLLPSCFFLSKIWFIMYLKIDRFILETYIDNDEEWEKKITARFLGRFSFPAD